MSAVCLVLLDFLTWSKPVMGHTVGQKEGFTGDGTVILQHLRVPDKIHPTFGQRKARTPRGSLLQVKGSKTTCIYKQNKCSGFNGRVIESCGGCCDAKPFSPAYCRGSTTCGSSFHCTGFPQRGTLSFHRLHTWLLLPSSASLSAGLT